jgi:hypothetical protein
MFKVGDRLVCVRGEVAFGLHEGDEVEVEVAGLGDSYVHVLFNGEEQTFLMDRFELASPNTNDAGGDTSMSIDETLEQRGSRYGTFKGHSELSQSLSRTIRTHTILNGKTLSDVHTEALNMICHKIARIVNGDPNYDDSWRDIAGYATLVVKEINGEGV